MSIELNNLLVSVVFFLGFVLQLSSLWVLGRQAVLIGFPPRPAASAHGLTPRQTLMEALGPSGSGAVPSGGVLSAISKEHGEWDRKRRELRATLEQSQKNDNTKGSAVELKLDKAIKEVGS